MKRNMKIIIISLLVLVLAMGGIIIKKNIEKRESEYLTSFLSEQSTLSFFGEYLSSETGILSVKGDTSIINLKYDLQVYNEERIEEDYLIVLADNKVINFNYNNKSMDKYKFDLKGSKEINLDIEIDNEYLKNAKNLNFLILRNQSKNPAKETLESIIKLNTSATFSLELLHENNNEITENEEIEKDIILMSENLNETILTTEEVQIDSGYISSFGIAFASTENGKLNLDLYEKNTLKEGSKEVIAFLNGEKIRINGKDSIIYKMDDSITTFYDDLTLEVGEYEENSLLNVIILDKTEEFVIPNIKPKNIILK